MDFWPWLGAIICFGVAFGWRTGAGVDEGEGIHHEDAQNAKKKSSWPQEWLESRRRRIASAWANPVDRWAALGFLGIMLVAVFFHTYRLNEIPVEMTSDHAEKLLDVNDVLSGMRPIFFIRNTGREALQFYLTALLIRLTPLTISHLALKVGTALAGLLTVACTYLLARQEYGRLAGLLATFFLATSTWHVAITRVGLRFPFTAAFAVPAVYFLLRALRHNRRNDWLLAGAVLGVGLHGYTAMRFVPLLFLALVGVKSGLDAWLYLRRRRSWEEVSAISWRFWRNATMGGLATLLLFLPLLRYMLEEPETFWYRAASRSLTESGTAPMSLLEIWRTFWTNVQNALLAFNWRGDTVPINTIPESPILGWVPGALFVLGAAYLLWRLVHYRQRRDIYLLLAFWVLLLPSILSLAFPIENPSVARMGGAVPFVMIIVALPLAAMVKRLLAIEAFPGGASAGRQRSRLAQATALLLVAGLLLSATWGSYQWYFVDYNAHTLRSLWNTTQMGAAVRDFLAEGGEMENVYHVPYPHWADTRNIAINAGHVAWHNDVSDLETVRRHAQNPAAKLYLVHLEDEAALSLLREVYPLAEERYYHSGREGKDFWLVCVPKGSGETTE